MTTPTYKQEAASELFAEHRRKREASGHADANPNYDEVFCIYATESLDAFAAHLVCRAGTLGASRFTSLPVDDILKVPPLPDDWRVIIAGFSYPYPDLVTLCLKTKSVTVLLSADQYRRQFVDTVDPSLDYPENLRVIYDPRKSTVGVAFAHYFPTLRLPWHYDAIQKLSLGQCDHSDTRHIAAAFMSVGFDAAAWGRLFSPEDVHCAKQAAIRLGSSIVNRIELQL